MPTATAPIPAAQTSAPKLPAIVRPYTFSTGPTTPAAEEAYFAYHLEAFRSLAASMNKSRIESAEAEHGFYNHVYSAGNVVDGYHTKIKLQKAGRLDNERYEIDRMASTCTCPDFKERIEPLRRQMLCVGATPLEVECVCCRHLFITEKKSRWARLPLLT